MIYRKVVGDDSSPGARKCLCLVDGGAFNNVESAQKQTRTLPNSKSERLSISPVLQNKELIAQCGNSRNCKETVNRV